jgi:membrane-bound ClpP family serine protease
MTKELSISLVLGAVLLLCMTMGLVQSTLLSNPFFLLFGLAIILGQVVMAHLAFNQYKSLTTQPTKESNENEEGRDRPGKERETDGFDD